MKGYGYLDCSAKPANTCYRTIIPQQKRSNVHDGEAVSPVKPVKARVRIEEVMEAKRHSIYQIPQHTKTIVIADFADDTVTILLH